MEEAIIPVTQVTRKLSQTSLAAPSSSAITEMFSMKVMHLPSPQLSLSNPLSVNRHSSHPGEGAALGNGLRLSSSLEKVYKGEMFRTCISLSHHARGTLTNVGVKIDMQTKTSKTLLLDATRPQDTFDFEFGQTKDYVVSHKLEETGTNCLVCCIHYSEMTPSGSQLKTFQKFYKFEVLNPFAIKSQIHLKEEVKLVEVTITSLIARVLTMEKVSLVGGPKVKFTALDAAEMAADEGVELVDAITANEPLCGRAQAMKAQDVRTYVFMATVLGARAEQWTDEALLQLQLELAWRSSVGESGSFTTKLADSKRILDQMQRPGSDFDLILLRAPAQVRLEVPFTISLLVRSRRDRPLEFRLKLIKEKMISILPCGLSNRSLGLIAPNGSKEVEITLIPLGLGLQKLTGFRLSVPALQSSIDFDAIHDIEVVAG